MRYSTRMRRKLLSGSGASFFAALLLFALCASIGVAVLSAAGAVLQLEKQYERDQQAYYAIMSAAELIRGAIASFAESGGLECEAVGRCIEYSCEAMESSPDFDSKDCGHTEQYEYQNLAVSNARAGSILDGALRRGTAAISSGMGMTYPPETGSLAENTDADPQPDYLEQFTLEIDDHPDFRTVYAEFRMSGSDIDGGHAGDCTVTLTAEGTGLKMTVSFAGELIDRGSTSEVVDSCTIHLRDGGTAYADVTEYTHTVSVRWNCADVHSTLYRGAAE